MAVASKSRDMIISAAIKMIRERGYSATRVDDLCAAAGLTKGGFFHHFKSKEDVALAAARAWSDHAAALFGVAAFRARPDPLDRLLGYIDFRRALLEGGVAGYSCLAGTMVQEVYDTHPAIREACERSIMDHAATLVDDIEAARAEHGVQGDWTAASLALHTQTVLQGAFVLAKATGQTQVARDSVDHLRRYIALLFRRDPRP